MRLLRDKINVQYLEDKQKFNDAIESTHCLVNNYNDFFVVHLIFTMFLMSQNSLS